MTSSSLRLRRTHRRTLLTTAIVALLLLTYDYVATHNEGQSTAATTTALTQLPVVRVEQPDATRTTYKRDDWQPHGWIDADGDGCNTRREVLIAEATRAPAVNPSGCRLSSGSWQPRFSATTVTNEQELQIDHLVSLADAHRSGGWRWTQERKIAFANNLDNADELNALANTVNEDKSDKGPDEWMPSSASDRCAYLRAYVTIKAQWDLSVTPEQWRAIAKNWPSCVT